MGLFDPPHVNIRNKVPAIRRGDFDVIEAKARQRLFDLRLPTLDYALSAILGMWVASCCRYGYLSMSDYDARYCFNAGNNCLKRLTPEMRRRVDDEILRMVAEGDIPNLDNVNGLVRNHRSAKCVEPDYDIEFNPEDVEADDDEVSPEPAAKPKKAPWLEW